MPTYDTAILVSTTGIDLGSTTARPDAFLQDLDASGVCKIQVVATASLPAAGAVNDGRILIEDNGTGDRNLVIYAGGQRFRVDGGAAI